MSASANDPRQPSAAKPYVPPPISPQDLPVDYSGFVALVFGITGVMLRLPHHLFLFLVFYDFGTELVRIQTLFVACHNFLCSVFGKHEEYGNRLEAHIYGHDLIVAFLLPVKNDTRVTILLYSLVHLGSLLSWDWFRTTCRLPDQVNDI